MAFIPAPTVAKAVLKGSVGAIPIINTLWFGKNTDWTEAALQLLTDALESWYNGYLKTDMMDNYTLDEITAYDMSSETGAVVSNVVGVPGDILDDYTSAQDVLSIKFGTANRGRSGRGGVRISPIPDTKIGNSAIDPIWSLSVASDFQALNTVVTGFVPDAEHVVVSFYNGGVARAQGLKQTVTYYAYPSNNARTLKRRRSSKD